MPSLTDFFDVNEITPAAICQIAGEIIPSELVQALLNEHGVQEQRHRRLSAVLVVWLCIALCWQARRSSQSILTRLLEIPSLFNPAVYLNLPSRSALTQARYRLGAPIFAHLFKQVCQPLVTEPTAWSHRFGLHLMALDGSVETVKDTAANAHYFGRSSGQYGDAAYPSCRVVYFIECGTHAIVDAAIGTYHQAECRLGWRLLRSVQANMLVLVDAGLTSFDYVYRIHSAASHILAPPASGAKLISTQILADGTFLTWLKPTNKSRHKKAKPIQVRVITYHVADPAAPHDHQTRRLITTLLDPLAYPALDLIECYHERWEIELAIDEIDTHQRLPNQPFRSRKPVGVIQEFYAMLIAHYILRYFMFQTAQVHQLDPDRLSFTFTLDVVWDALPLFQLMPRQFHPYLLHWLETWLLQVQNPPRILRWNPRVIKRQRSKFARKRPEHLRPPKPTCSFRASIVLT